MTPKIQPLLWEPDWFSWRSIAQYKQDLFEHALDLGYSEMEAHFVAARWMEEALGRKPTYRERQAIWKSRQMSVPKEDPLIEALKAIRDGHNDPRALATEVLEKTNASDKT